MLSVDTVVEHRISSWTHAQKRILSKSYYSILCTILLSDELFFLNGYVIIFGKTAPLLLVMLGNTFYTQKYFFTRKIKYNLYRES